MKHTVLLRWSLLASLGLLPLACSDDDDEGDDGGSAGSAGKGGSAGQGTSAGAGGSSAGQGGASDPGGAGAGGTATREPPTCTDPKVDSLGLTRCKEGYRYRAEPQTCAERGDEVLGSGGAGGSGGEGRGEGGATAQAFCDDCEGEHAYCRKTGSAPGQAPYTCTRGCLTDEECGENSLCLCDGEKGGFCTPATCRGDDDCQEGYHCAELEFYCAVEVGDFACQTPDDECLTSAECDDATCTMEADLGDPLKRTCEQAV